MAAAVAAAERSRPKAVFLLTPSKAIELATGNTIKLGQRFDLDLLKRTFKDYTFDTDVEEGETYWNLTKGPPRSPTVSLSLLLTDNKIGAIVGSAGAIDAYGVEVGSTLKDVFDVEKLHCTAGLDLSCDNPTIDSLSYTVEGTKCSASSTDSVTQDPGAAEGVLSMAVDDCTKIVSIWLSLPLPSNG